MKAAQSKRNLRQMVPKAYQIEYYEGLNFRTVKPHTHVNYEFYLYLEGSTVMDLGEESYILDPGDLVIIPPGLSHVAHVDPDIFYSRFDFWLPPEFIKGVPEMLRYATDRADKGEYIFSLSLVDANTLSSKLFGIIEEQRTMRYAKDDKVYIMFAELLLLISRFIVEKDEKGASGDDADIFTLICNYIDSHIMDDLSIERLSKEFFVSKSYLSHLFLDTTGVSLHKFIQKKKLAIMRDDIKSGVSISKVFEESGIKDYSTFYRAFKKEYGLTPSEYEKSVHAR